MRAGRKLLMSRATKPPEITPDLVLQAYSIGLFPMAETAEQDHLFWVTRRPAAFSRSRGSSSREASRSRCAAIATKYGSTATSMR